MRFLYHHVRAIGLVFLQSILQILGHLFLGNADEINIKFKAKSWLECNVDFLLGSCIDKSLVVVKLEAFLQDFCRIRHLFLSILQSHLKFDEQVTVALICNDD